MQLSNEDESLDDTLVVAREEFRSALIDSHKTRSSVGDLEAAAARFCRVLRSQGHTPERALIDAKKVIEDTIDGHDVPIAERAVLSCIQHYFRD